MTFLIPGMLRRYAEEKAEVALETAAADVGGALATLFTRYPGLQDRVLDDRGEIRRHVNVFLGNESVRDLAGLATALSSSGSPAVVSVFAAVSGG